LWLAAGAVLLAGGGGGAAGWLRGIGPAERGWCRDSSIRAAVRIEARTMVAAAPRAVTYAPAE
jgi:hypothetical protein